MDRNNGAAGGMTLSGTLTVIFVVLKLCGVIHWSWLWVLCPMWLPAVIFGIVLLWVLRKYK